MIIANIIAIILVIIGSLNWGLVGIFKFNLVEWITMGFNGWSIAIYVIVMLAGIWLIISPIISKGMIDFGCKYKKESEQR